MGATVEERKARIRATRDFRQRSELDSRVHGAYGRPSPALLLFIFFAAWLIGAVWLISGGG